jgi:hypothetical protein
MLDAKVMAYLTGNALYLTADEPPAADAPGGGGPGKPEPLPQLKRIDLTESAQPVTVDASTYKEIERAFDWVFYPLLMLAFFTAFAIALAFSALVYAVIGMIFAALAKGSLEFAPLFRLGIHAQTAGSLLYALNAILPRSIPFYTAVSVALSLTFLWLGVRAAVKAAPAEPTAPAA